MQTIDKIWYMFGLKFRDHLEEQEYVEIKTPLTINFFTVLLITISGILIPYAVRYFIKDLSPQNYIIIALLPIVLVFLFFRKRLGKYTELFLTAYMIAIIAILTTVYRDLLPQQTQNESFYTGYSFAMIIRLLGYNMVSLKYAILIYLVQIPLKFALVPTPDALQIIIALALDLVTVGLSWKSEVVERDLFDMLYKMKKSVLKFKHLLTQYLPNQIAIFALDYSMTYYINNAFKRAFKTKDINLVKGALEKLLIESDTIEKHKTLFKNLGFKNFEDENFTINLSAFMNALSINADLLRDIGSISLPVIEEEKEVLQNENSPRELSPRNKAVRKIGPPGPNESTTGAKKDGTMIDPNDSVKQSERGSSSKSHSSDVVYEEGRRKVFRVKIFPLVWDETEAIAMVMDDITQQKIIMELKVADKNKDLVIAMVSHELRTPLNGLLGLLDIARKDVKEPETLSYLQACRDSGVLMLNLINSILDINQIKNKKLRLVYSKFSLPNFLYEIKNLFNYSCKVKNLYLKVEIDANVPEMIITDRNRLSQILVNLLGNAFKFTFRGGVTLGVSLEYAQTNQLRFYVKDTGIGIKKEDQEKLFKMYGKLEQQDRKINTQGIGLGLTISNTLAELLNTTENHGIKVESEVDVGTCFSFIVQSQHPETSSMREVEEGTLEEMSAAMFNEEKDMTIVRRMTTYTNYYDNYSKMPSSSQNVVYASQNQLEYKKPFSPPFIHAHRDEEEDDQHGGSRIAFPSMNLNEDNNLINSSRTNASQQELLKPNPALPLSHQKKISEVAEDNEQESMLDNSIDESLGLGDKGAAGAEKEDKSQKPWCLVVDDNPFNLMVACHIMEERGYRVKTALNGREAINEFTEHESKGFVFKLTLMDCQMPVMDGYQATKALKEMMKDGQLHDCPIIALTANNRDEEHDKLCQQVGMSGHITKPLQIIELEAILKKLRKVRK